MGLLDGVRITVETSSLPTITINPADQSGEPPGLLVKALRPRISVWSGSTLIHRVQPAGDPHVGPPWGILLLVAAVGALAYWKLR